MDWTKKAKLCLGTANVHGSPSPEQSAQKQGAGKKNPNVNIVNLF